MSIFGTPLHYATPRPDPPLRLKTGKRVGQWGGVPYIYIYICVCVCVFVRDPSRIGKSTGALLGQHSWDSMVKDRNQPMIVRKRLLNPDRFHKVVLFGVEDPSTEEPRVVVGSIRATAAAELFAMAAAPLALGALDFPGAVSWENRQFSPRVQVPFGKKRKGDLGGFHRVGYLLTELASWEVSSADHLRSRLFQPMPLSPLLFGTLYFSPFSVPLPNVCGLDPGELFDILSMARERSRQCLSLLYNHENQGSFGWPKF